MLTRLLIAGILFLVQSKSWSQEQLNNSSNNHNIHINFKEGNYSLENNDRFVYISTNNYEEDYTDAAKKEIVSFDKENSFYIKNKNTFNIYVSFFMGTLHSPNGQLTLFKNLFLEPGDTILLTHDNHSIDIKSTISNRILLNRAIRSETLRVFGEKKVPTDSTRQSFLEENFFTNKSFERLYERQLYIYHFQELLIDKYTERLTKKEYETFKNDLKYGFASDLTWGVIILTMKDRRISMIKTDEDAVFKSYYSIMEKAGINKVLKVNPSLLETCPRYRYYLMKRTYVEMYHNNSDSIRDKYINQPDVFTRKLCDSMLQISDPRSKEWLLVTLLHKQKLLAVKTNYYIDSVIFKIKSQDLNQFAKDILLVKMDGLKSLGYLVDESDKKIYLSSFKGKVLILDLWYTGCHPCQMMAKKMKTIQNKYLDNEDVIFLSVSIDEDKKTWIESISENPSHYASGLKNEKCYRIPNKNKSSIIESFKIQSYPTLICINKKEKPLLTFTDPRKDEGEDLISLIDKCLSE